MSTPIQPSPKITTKIITSYVVNVIRLELFTSVTVNAMLYGADGGFIEVKTLTLSGQDYIDWNNNDQYLVNKVAEILGFVIINPIPDPPIPELVPELVPVTTVPELVPVTTVPELVPVTTVPELVPVTTVPELVPVTTVPELVPVTTVPELVPVTTVPELVPVTTVPELVPVTTVPEPSV